MSDFFAAGNGEPRSRHHVTMFLALFQARVPGLPKFTLLDSLFSVTAAALAESFFLARC